MKRMLTIIILVVTLFTCVSCTSQAKVIDLTHVYKYTEQDILDINNKTDEEIFVRNNLGYISEIWGKFTNVEIIDKELAADAIWSVNELLGIKNPYLELRCTEFITDKYVNQSTYYQTYKGYSVLGSYLRITQSKVGDEYDSLTSFLVPTELLEKADARPDVSLVLAKEIIYNHYEGVRYNTISLSEINWMEVTDPETQETTVEMVFAMEVNNEYIVYIDTTDGRILMDTPKCFKSQIN